MQAKCLRLIFRLAARLNAPRRLSCHLACVVELVCCLLSAVSEESVEGGGGTERQNNLPVINGDIFHVTLEVNTPSEC